MTLRDLSFSCPGKVFIVGEYTCIVGGDAILAAIEPSFELRMVEKKGGGPLPFAAQSPAGKYLSAYPEILSRFEFQWRDPYSTPIGVGSSSAQFLLSVDIVRTASGMSKLSDDDLLKAYWNATGDSQGLRPSGVDVLAQRTGSGAMLCSNSPAKAVFIGEKKPSGAVFLLAFTGSKAKTHEHLIGLKKKGFPESFAHVFPALDTIVKETIKAWKEGDAPTLGKSLNAYQEELARADIAPLEFHAKVSELQKADGVLGAKGSGAQGGDCVLVLCEPTKKKSVSRAISEMGWQPIDPRWT